MASPGVKLTHQLTGLPPSVALSLRGVTHMRKLPTCVDEALEFATFLVRTTIDMQRFTTGTVGIPSRTAGCRRRSECRVGDSRRRQLVLKSRDAAQLAAARQGITDLRLTDVGCVVPSPGDWRAWWRTHPANGLIKPMVRRLENRWACKRLLGSNPSPAVRSTCKHGQTCRALYTLKAAAAGMGRDKTSSRDPAEPAPAGNGDETLEMLAHIGSGAVITFSSP